MRAARARARAMSREKIDAPSAKLGGMRCNQSGRLHRESARSAIAARRRARGALPKLVRDGLLDDKPPRRDAGFAIVQARAEFERAHDEIEIGIGKNDHRVFAGKFHHRGRVGLREAGENVAAVFGRAGKDDLVHAVSDGVVRGLDALGQDVSSAGSRPASERASRKSSETRACRARA